ncbi:MAG: OmpA family protein [Cyclobacteriaceae bacterium]|nr:OmpA family protein [Cyclobacteriaceae bacterium]
MKKLLIIGYMFVCWSSYGQEHEIIRSIYFGGGSYYIDLEQYQTLEHFLDSLPYLENYQISISSHTDNIGSASYNMWLSHMRSEAVMFVLTQNEILREQVLIKNNGKHNPYFDNKSNIGRMSNRRVDIIFTPPVF